MFDVRRFKAQMVLMGVTGKMLAEKLNINESTLYRKLNAGGDFTREEINIMIDYLKFDNPLEVFFAHELAYTQD